MGFDRALHARGDVVLATDQSRPRQGGQREREYQVDVVPRPVGARLRRAGLRGGKRRGLRSRSRRWMHLIKGGGSTGRLRLGATRLPGWRRDRSLRWFRDAIFVLFRGKLCQWERNCKNCLALWAASAL